MGMEKEMVDALLHIGAVQINTTDYFTWTSGIKSPIYCDNRIIMSYPEIRKKVTTAFIEKLNINSWQPDVIAGCATAGIPHAAWLSNALDLPMVYVRSKAKSHGKGNQIEGMIKPGQRVLVIEDLISTGGSSIAAAKALENEGVEVIGVLAIFAYGLKRAEENFRSAGFSYHTILNFDQLLEKLVTNNELSNQDGKAMLEWRTNI
jgi:orotate phosphoribosyltransferase